MTTQPEALRLAGELSKSHLNHHINHAAAAELRRLSAENRALTDALLEALELLVSYTQSCEGLLNASPAGQVLKARAAIKAVEGETE